MLAIWLLDDASGGRGLTYLGDRRATKKGGAGGGTPAPEPLERDAIPSC